MLRVIWILFGSQQPIVLLFKTPQAYVGEGWFAGPRRTTVVHRRFFVQFFRTKRGWRAVSFAYTKPRAGIILREQRASEYAGRDASERARARAREWAGRAMRERRGERRRGQAGAAALKAGEAMRCGTAGRIADVAIMCHALR